ncbi:DNA alkylation repair protein [Dysgonomonas sp. OttesenSCG-928-M03]|nr:DNA alkylation repair protein [Dysgonomonas sp. OttesenSCG-928-M03]
MSHIITNIRHTLTENIDEKVKASGQNYFKEKIKLYGVRVLTVTQISKELFKQIESRSKAEIFSLCEELWKSGYTEETYIACNWAYYINQRYDAGDFNTFEKWVNKYVDNWASCDTLCNHAVGSFIEMYPQYISELKRWAKSDNRWVRRAAAVTLIIPARKGLFLKDIFEIADILLLDKDDLVQKGYGWMLKATSQAHQEEVFDYIMSKKKIMPRTSLRYAIEKMSQELKVKAMEK